MDDTYICANPFAACCSKHSTSSYAVNSTKSIKNKEKYQLPNWLKEEEDLIIYRKDRTSAKYHSLGSDNLFAKDLFNLSGGATPHRNQMVDFYSPVKCLSDASIPEIKICSPVTSQSSCNYDDALECCNNVEDNSFETVLTPGDNLQSCPQAELPPQAELLNTTDGNLKALSINNDLRTNSDECVSVESPNANSPVNRKAGDKITITFDKDFGIVNVGSRSDFSHPDSHGTNIYIKKNIVENNKKSDWSPSEKSDSSRYGIGLLVSSGPIDTSSTRSMPPPSGPFSHRKYRVNNLAPPYQNYPQKYNTYNFVHGSLFSKQSLNYKPKFCKQINSTGTSPAETVVLVIDTTKHITGASSDVIDDEELKNLTNKTKELEKKLILVTEERNQLLNEKTAFKTHNQLKKVSPRIRIDDYPFTLDLYKKSEEPYRSEAGILNSRHTNPLHLYSSEALSIAGVFLERDPEELYIFQAVRQSNFSIVSFDITSGIPVNVVHYGLPCFVKDPNLTTHIRLAGYGLLHVAVCHSSFEMVQELLLAGCDVNMLDSTHRTPLFLACVVNRLDIAQLLIQSGSDVNIQANSKKSALMRAVTNRNLALVEALIAAGCDINVEDATGSTALYLASMSPGSDTLIMEALIKAGANLNQGNKMGATPLHIAVQARQRLAIDVLVKSGAEINIADCQGRQPIHCASAGKQYLDLICMLAWYGADLNAKEHNGKLPIDYAIQYGNILAVKFLISCEAIYNPSLLQNPFILKACQTYPKFNDWLRDETAQPKSLLTCCRKVIRRTIPPTKLRLINKLELPQSLLKYLALRYEIEDYCKDSLSLRHKLEQPRRLTTARVSLFQRTY